MTHKTRISFRNEARPGRDPSRALFTAHSGRFGVEVGGVGDDDYPMSVALGHQVVDVAFAVRPVGTITPFGPGHGPVIVHRNKFGGESSYGLYRVRAMRVLVESSEEGRVLVLDLLAAVDGFTSPINPLDVIGKCQTHRVRIVGVPTVVEIGDNLLYC